MKVNSKNIGYVIHSFTPVECKKRVAVVYE